MSSSLIPLNTFCSRISKIDQAMLEHGGKYRGHHTSMLQDIIKGRRTEINEWNGYVIERGKEVGIPTPANEAVLGLFNEVESGKLKYSPVNIDILEQKVFRGIKLDDIRRRLPD